MCLRRISDWAEGWLTVERCVPRESAFREMELCWVGWAIGGSGSRSPLVARLTEMVTTAALSAVTGLVNALMPPAMKQLKSEAAAKFLSLLLV